MPRPGLNPRRSATGYERDSEGLAAGQLEFVVHPACGAVGATTAMRRDGHDQYLLKMLGQLLASIHPFILA